MATTRTPQQAAARFSRAQRPPSSPNRRGVASGRSTAGRGATTGRRFGTPTAGGRFGTVGTTGGRRFGRTAPKQSAMQRAFGALGSALPGGSKATRSSSKKPGGKSAGGLALLAAAGVAIAKRDKLTSMLRRDDSASTGDTGYSTVTAGTATTPAPSVDPITPAGDGHTSAP